MKTNSFYDKLFDLIEKECDMFDTRPKKSREMHPGNGECYMNDIMILVQKKIKEEARLASLLAFNIAGYPEKKAIVATKSIVNSIIM